MWVLEYQGSEKKNLVKKTKPVLKKISEAIVKVLRATICGTDLHTLKR